MDDSGEPRCIVPSLKWDDATKDPLNPLNLMFLQMALMLVMSHIFYLFLKPLGQSGPIAQIIAGMLLSPTLLSRVTLVKAFYMRTMSFSYFNFLVFLFRVFFMFLIGLEMDFDFMKRNLRRAFIIAVCGMICCIILALAFVRLFLTVLNIHSDKGTFSLIYIMVVSNTASPVVYRMVSDLKLDTSDVGRLAISSALLIEMTLNAIYTLVYSFLSNRNFLNFFLGCFFTCMLIIVNWYLAPWFSAWYPNEKYISKAQVLFFFVHILVLSTLIESRNLSSAIPTFLLGLMFPRNGKAYRTMLQVLRFPIHEFVLPVYFGYIGYRLTLPHVETTPGANKAAAEDGYAGEYLILGLTILSSFLGKIVGTLGACCFEKVSRNHSVFLACILCMKGHFAITIVDMNPQLQLSTYKMMNNILVSAGAIVTLISGMLASSFRRKEERSFVHTKTTLESHGTESELRMLSCVHNHRQTVGAISLISALSRSQQTPFTPLLMHLVELPLKKKSKLKYNEPEEEAELSHDDDYGRNDVIDINDSVDSFAKESKVLIHQLKIVSSLSNMCEDLCNEAEDLRVSIIFLPFHKHQRVDGKIKNDGEGIRRINQKVLYHSPCSIGIFMERSQTGFQQPHGSETMQNVATLFFGGPDDREALALSRWIVGHPQIHLTLIRFSPKSLLEQKPISESSHRENEVLMSISSEDTENERDGNFLEEFRSRYVSSGEVAYVEKRVDDGAETLAFLQEIGPSYSLFVVGKGRGDCPMTAGMNDWEECPEIGSVGDLLACSKHNIRASVLIVQKHRHSNGNLMNE